MKHTLVMLICAMFLLAPSAVADDENEIKADPITLKAEGVHPRDVMADLTKETGIPIYPYPEQMYQPNYGGANLPTSVTIDVDRQPFWVAFEEFCKEAHLQPSWNGMEGIPLQNSGNGNGPFGKKPTSVGEHATFVADSLQRSHTINLDSDNPQAAKTCGMNISGFVDPRLRVNRYAASVTIEKAEDENGNSLAQQPQQENNAMNSMNNPWQIGSVFIPLEYDPEKSHKLAVIKGSFRVLAAGTLQKFSVDDLSKLDGNETTIAGRTMIFSEVKQEERSMSFKVTIQRESMSTEEWQSMFEMINRTMKLVSENGKRYQLSGGGGGSDKQVVYTLSSNWNENDEKPSKLVWDIPADYHELDLPFEFKDLTLP
ncbi:MAG TPA: hypothetical protein VL282_16235 [Tepidisphaeraceae bacterium]|nr:hypothetical protein [Tepidisphaeraceae bacterium]